MSVYNSSISALCRSLLADFIIQYNLYKKFKIKLSLFLNYGINVGFKIF